MNQERLWNKLYSNKLEWKKETASLPKILKNKKVLELGVGTGKTLISILKQKPKSVTAIDFSQTALDKIPKIIKEKANIIKADAKSLPLEDNSFDVVICYYVLNNSITKEMKKIISEIYRVLDTEGIVLFEDFGAKDFRNKKTKRKDGLHKHFFTGKEVRELFNKFKLKQFKIVHSYPLKSQPEMKREIIRFIGMN